MSSALAAHASIINKVAAIAGIVHASCMVGRLMPQEKEKVKTEFTLPEPVINEIKNPTEQVKQAHHGHSHVQLHTMT